MYDELRGNMMAQATHFSVHDETSLLLLKAADAIEELIRKEKFHAFLWNTIQPNEMEQYISMYNSGNIPQKPPESEDQNINAE